MSLYPLTERQKWLDHCRLQMQSRCFQIDLDVPDREPIRLTDHNRALSFLGHWWYPASPDDPIDKVGGVRGRDIDRREGMQQQVSQLQGILSSELISAEDIRAGRYRGALVTEFWVDRRDIFASSFYGYRNARQWRVAEIQVTTDDTFGIELVSVATYHLHRRRGATTSRGCRYRLFSDSVQTGGFCNRSQSITGAGLPPLSMQEWQIGHGPAAADYCTLDSFLSRRQIQIAVPIYDIVAITATNPCQITLDRAHNFWGPYDGSQFGRTLRFGLLIAGLPPPDGNNLNGFWPVGSVTNLGASAITVDADNTSGGGFTAGGLAELSPDDNWFAEGALEFLNPALPSAYTTVDIESSTGVGSRILLTLHDSIRFTETEINECRITTGCDGAATTCQDKFANIVNFGGEPSIPGSSRVIATPDSPS